MLSKFQRRLTHHFSLPVGNYYFIKIAEELVLLLELRRDLKDEAEKRQQGTEMTSDSGEVEVTKWAKKLDPEM